MSWHSIESAPLDGTKIWGFNNPTTARSKIVVMCFRDRAGQKRWMTEDSRPLSNPIFWQPLSATRPTPPNGYEESFNRPKQMNPPWFFSNKWQLRRPETPAEWADWIWGPSGDTFTWEQIFSMIASQAIDRHEQERQNTHSGALTIPLS